MGGVDAFVVVIATIFSIKVVIKVDTIYDFDLVKDIDIVANSSKFLKLKKKKHHDAKSFEPSVETFASVGFFGDVGFVPNTVTFSEHLQSLRRRGRLFGQRPRQRSHRRRREKFQQSGPVESHESVALWKRFRFGFLRYG